MSYPQLALIACLAIILPVTLLGQPTPPKNLNPPVEEGIWIRPAKEHPAEPVIGFKDGIRISLWPSTRGPRGLIRILTPYVFPKDGPTLINFIAVEPIVEGWRSLSELESSSLDGMRGKRFWFSDDIGEEPSPLLSWNCPRGKLGKLKVGTREIETLSIVVDVEELDNGARPRVLVTFRSDRPNEVGFKVYSAESGKLMESCVLTATMGNFSRVRHLWLKDEVVNSRKVWPNYQGHDFMGTDHFPSDRMQKLPDGSLIAAVTPDEKILSTVDVSPGWWMFRGKAATQYWRKYPGSARPDLRVNVNGRARYYGTSTLIPGGVSFENFELIESFEPGLESWFGVTLKTPRIMGWKARPSD